MNNLDIGIIVGSLLIVMGVGFWSSRRRTGSAADYFLASRKLPWFLIGSSFVATSVSSEQIVGTVGATYQHGLKIANGELWSLPAYTLLIAVFIPIYLRNRITTMPEFLSRRYGPFCADLYSWIMLVAYMLIFMVPVLYGSSLALSKLTGWNYSLVLWAIVVLVGAYTVKGGLASVVWTDAAQCAMLLGGGIVLFFVALDRLPGGLFEAWSAIKEADPDRFHLYQPANDPIVPFAGLIVSTFGLALFYQASNQAMIQRVLAARSVWDGKMGIVFAGFVNFLRPLVTSFLGLIVYYWIHHLGRAETLENADQAMPFALEVLAPDWGLRGIVLAGFLAAVMSTISSLANSIATIFAFDVYGRFKPGEQDDHRLVVVGQAASIVALVIAALVSPIVSRWGIFVYFQSAVTYLATPFASVVLLGVFWRRTNYAGAVFGIVGGLLIQIATVITLHLRDIHINWLYHGFIAQVITLFGIMVVSLNTPAPIEGKWWPFLWRPALIWDRGDEPARPWYQRLSLWFGVYAVLWFSIYWWLW